MNYRADQKDLALADYLAAHSGIRGLALLGADELDRVRTHFERDGFVVIRDAHKTIAFKMRSHSIQLISSKQR